MNTVIPDVALIDNSDERAPLVLVLDCSGSMQEQNKIQLLNEGLKTLAADLKADPIAARCGRVLVISFGGDADVEIMGDWTDAMDFVPPELLAGGLTPLGAAMRCALDESRVAEEPDAHGGRRVQAPDHHAAVGRRTHRRLAPGRGRLQKRGDRAQGEHHGDRDWRSGQQGNPRAVQQQGGAES
jgi:hypothetical protein